MKYLYLLDANVFIEAKNKYYAFDLCPGFWEWLITPNNVMVRVASIDKVKEEILEKEDELADWAKNLDENFFLKSDDDDDLYVRSSLKEVSEWIDERYDPRKTFLECADYYLVGYSLAYGYTVVTHEGRRGKTFQVKIPDVCDGLKIPVIDTFEMLREAEVIFILG